MAAGEDQLEPLVGDERPLRCSSRSWSTGATSSWSVEQWQLLSSVRRRRSRSIAALRAVRTSQPAGLSGTPSRGQRAAAVANASWTTSSARSKSRRYPTSEARTRPHSSRKTRG